MTDSKQSPPRKGAGAPCESRKRDRRALLPRFDVTAGRPWLGASVFGALRSRRGRRCFVCLMPTLSKARRTAARRPLSSSLFI